MPQARLKKLRGKKPKVVVIGGGTGTYQTLLGLKKYPLDIATIVTMADSGGSSGRLRKHFKMLPPGDVRQALLALSCLPMSQRTLERLFDYRFPKGGELTGHSVGNLILAALTQITGSEEEAIAQAEKLLATCGHVYPVTTQATHLVAELENGEKIFSEAAIDTRAEKANSSTLSPIKKVYLTPKVYVSGRAEKAIKRANLIVLAPGDLYTSLIPNLLVEGVPEAIAQSGGILALVVNLMTKPGETDGYKASDFVRIVKKYLGPAGDKLKFVIVNKGGIGNADTLARYRKEGQIPVEDDLGKRVNGAFVIRGRLAYAKGFVRHDPGKLAKMLIKIIYQGYTG